MRSGRPTATPMVASAPGSARWRTQTGHRHGLPKARKAEIQVPRKTKRRARALLRRLQKTAPGLEGRPGQCKRAKLGAVVAAPSGSQLTGLAQILSGWLVSRVSWTTRLSGNVKGPSTVSEVGPIPTAWKGLLWCDCSTTLKSTPLASLGGGGSTAEATWGFTSRCGASAPSKEAISSGHWG